MYDRKIIYLHRYEKDTDKGNAGYLKQEKRDEICSFSVVLLNLPPDYRADGELCVSHGGQALCKVHIKDGRGQGMALYEEKQLKEMGILYEELKGYEIRLQGETRIFGESVSPKGTREEVRPIEKEKTEDIIKPMEKKEDIIKPIENAQDDAINEQPETVKSPFFDRERRIYKNKWEQLSSGRTRVSLMGKESEYIKITPKDMVALSSAYHNLVNNAFLLHGYYNYNHLILGPSKGNKSTYFIGVPGNFYKQEVNAARMFGFEYFENGAGKVEVGDFGYYMKKVKL